MVSRRARWILVFLPLVVLAPTTGRAAAELKILLPLGRTAYQTNETIDIAIARHAAAPLAAGNLALSVVGDDGSKLSFTFPLKAAPTVGNEARATEHLHLNGWLLRPGHYTLSASADGAAAQAAVDVYSHLRKSDYRLICWGRATGAAQLVEGEDNLGFNLFLGNYAADDEANFIRAGMDFMSCCTMSGGHQMDLRQECDWSDPYVTRGGTWRVARRAMIDRTRPNVPGVHFYDEPGLSWFKHPVTGEITPHELPSQVRSYRSAFGKDPIPYYQVQPDDARQAAEWRQWAIWKLGFMDAAWKEAQFGVSYIRPDFLSVTQTQYGFPAFSDGIYFNAARALPVVSGHGGYDDYGLGYFNPSYTLELARARDFGKPNWYLPTWYANTPSERFRLEQNLSFITGLQGMMTPPDIDPFEPASKPAAEGVVESNKLMARLGTIFTTMPVTPPPVAMLYSMSENLYAQTRDMHANYAHDNGQGQRLPLTYLAGKILQQQFMTVVEEDIVDGTLAARHKAVILTSVDWLDPKVIKALEQFAAQGGLVLVTANCQVKIDGAINLGVTPDFPDAEIVRRLVKEKKYGEAAPYVTLGKQLEGAAPLARAIKAQLDRAGIKPILASDQPGIVAARQADGDIEYLFAVNATYDPAVGGLLGIQAVEATLGIEADGRPVYDALLGRAMPAWKQEDSTLTNKFRFGPGQMRVFCRTAKPIGGVQALTPSVRCDLTKSESPLYVEAVAVLSDTEHRILAGSAPMEIRLVDPLGNLRHQLFRATRQGMLKLTLPLAANDPAGAWKLHVRELLSNHEDTATFHFAGLPAAGAIAGLTPRAVSFANESDNVFRFFRVHHDIKIVIGTANYHQAAAARLAESLKPWGVRCEIVAAADVNRPREITAEEAPTWVGLEFGPVKAGRDNDPGHAGFDIRGPVVLLGTPQDNPLVAYLQKQRYLPNAPDPQDFPGPCRGMVAWQRDGIGPGQESIVLLAYDATGMSEAVGTVYEAAAGMAPLTRWTTPSDSALQRATLAKTAQEAAIVWQQTLADRAVGMHLEGNQLTVLTWDGSLVRLDGNGKIVDQQVITWQELPKKADSMKPVADPQVRELAKKSVPAERIIKYVAANDGMLAIGCWGGALYIVRADGTQATSQLMPQDIAGMSWLEGRLVVALADGRIIAVAKP